MRRSRIFVVKVFLVVAVISGLVLDLASPSLDNVTMKQSTPDVATSSVAATSRRGLVHCEIAVSASDRRPEMRLATTSERVIATPTTISGSGCDHPDTVTSLTLKIVADDANGINLPTIDQLPVCRFSNIERVTIVGQPLNESVTSLNCFRNIRHLTLKHADIDVIQPSLIYDSFRARDFRSVDVLDSGVDDLAYGVFDGRRMKCLEEVNLSNNNLTKIANATFTNLETLTTLNLSHNAIRYIAPGAFANADIRYSSLYTSNCFQCSFVMPASTRGSPR